MGAKSAPTSIKMCIRDSYKADGTKVYSAGDVVAESLTTGTDGQVVLSCLLYTSVAISM